MNISCKENVKGNVAELLAKLVSQTEEAIVCVDCSSHEVVLFNPGAEKVFGWSADEILGKSVVTIMPIQEKNSVVETVGIKKDGTKFPIEVSVATIELEGIEYCAAIVRTSAAVKAAELATYRRTTKQQLLREVGAIANLRLASHS